MFNMFHVHAGRVKPLFEDMFSKLTQDNRFTSFFFAHQSTDVVRDALIGHFLNVHTMKKEELKKFYFRLGRKHAAMGIPFAAFERVTDLIHHDLLAYFAGNSAKNVMRLETYSFFMINRVASGYFEYEKEAFQARLRHLNKHAQNTEMLKDYIEWFLMLHTVLTNENIDFSSELKKDKPSFTHIPESSYGALLDAIRQTEKEFFSELTSMSYSLDRNDYRHMLDSYHRLKECFFSIISLLSMLEQNIVNDTSQKDPLTKALTRKRMQSVVEKAAAVSDAGSKPMCVCITDIDHFKKVNDTYGHKSGDQVLVQFAATLMKHSASLGGTVIRYGGEEFVIVLPECGIEKGAALMEDLRLIVEMLPVRIDSGMMHITASFGVVEWCADGASLPDATEIIRLADEKLYTAKQLGRNRVER